MYMHIHSNILYMYMYKGMTWQRSMLWWLCMVVCGASCVCTVSGQLYLFYMN